MSMPKLDKIVDVVDIEDIANRTASKISGIASDLNKVVSELEKGFISDIGEYYDKVDQYGSLVRKVMNIIFSFNLALAVAFVVFVILLISCQCGGCLLCILLFSFIFCEQKESPQIRHIHNSLFSLHCMHLNFSKLLLDCSMLINFDNISLFK